MRKKLRNGAFILAGMVLGVTAVLATNHVLNAESVPNVKPYTVQQGQTIVTSTQFTSQKGSSTEEVQIPAYPTNEQGQTYGEGPLLPGKTQEPDLINAENENGIEGYIKSSDLESGATTPEEALQYQESINAPELRSIPLYKLDGETIIGEFKIGSTQSN
ncbi:hypothetical protein [Paenibacillus sp. 276b]|uniref:hypothetical protein n=1 Tax=Paenibacillus sp. 276b TaxID=1566277 RepID=UPI00089D8E24|nr:hypothetical protein [Paenibacillus sp. 276b]SEB27642.1 hypothetical protein SAMN03159332_6318 [Paenibacillus sp. 276b]